MQLDVICADTLTAGVTGWAIDRNTGRLYRIAGGALFPTILLGMTNPVELVEKAVDPAAPLGIDVNLYAVGATAAGQPRVTAYDRSTALGAGSVLLAGVAGTPTGIASAKNAYAYVTLNVGGVGRLYQLTLGTLAWVTTPIATYATAALDVSVAGAFVLTTVAAATTGTTVYGYDAGDPTTILAAGYATLSATNGVSGLSSWIAATGTIDDIYCLSPHAGTGATSVGLVQLRDIWVDPSPTFGPTGYTEPVTTLSEIGMKNYEFLCCTSCPPYNYSVGTGAVDNANPTTASSSGTATLGDPTCGGGGGGTRSTGEGGTFIDLPSTCGVQMGLTVRGRREFDVGYGQGVFLSLDERMVTQANGDETYYSGMGRSDTYTKQSAGVYSAPLQYDTQLSVTGSSKQATDRFNTVTTFAPSGERTSKTDRNGNTTTYTYSSGKLTKVTDPFGREINLTYATGSYRRLTSISDCCGKTWTFRYDYLNRLRAVRSPTSSDFPAGRTTWLSYLPNSTDTRVRNNLVEQWSPTGDKVLTLGYDSDDRVISETVGTAQTSISYSVASSKTTVVDLDGNTTEFVFDVNSNVTSKKQFTRGLRSGEPASFDTAYTYNTRGYASTIVHPRGNRTDLTYNSSLDLTEVRHRLANTSTNATTDIVHAYTYGTNHQRTGYTDPRGKFTQMVLDSVGNRIEVDHPTVTSPTSQTIKDYYSYDSKGRLTSAIDGEGREITFSYYTSGAMEGWLHTMVRDPGGLDLTTTFSYTDCGNVGSVTDPNGHVTTFTIDDEGYVTEIQAPTPLSYRIRFTYDANRNVVKSETENIDRKGNVDSTTPWIDTVMTYDGQGRLTSRRARISPTVTATTYYEYSAAGRLSKITSAEGNQTTFQWDERGLLFKATRGAGTSDASTVQFDYDANGNRVKVTDGRGNATTLDYDMHDRVVKLTNALGHYATYAYDLSSNLLTVSRFSSSTALMSEQNRHFDEINRLWKSVDSKFQYGSGSVQYPTTTYSRDKGHLLVDVEDPLGNSTTYAYDDARRLLTATDAESNVRALEYDDNSNVTKVSVTEAPASGSPETLVTEYDFDVVNRVKERREIDRTNSSNILTTTYEYDSRSNLTFRTDAEGHPTRWTYDLASRLLQRERALSLSGGVIDNFATAIVEQFAYDLDNRLTSLTDDNSNTTTYAFDALDRATTTAYADSKSVASTFDKNGNVMSWTDQNGTVVTNTFDVLDRLTARSISRGTGVLGTTAEGYTYDALDRLIGAVDNDYQVERTFDSVGNLLRDRQGYNSSGNEKWKNVDVDFDLAGRRTSISYPNGLVVGHQRDAIGRLGQMDDVGASAAIAIFTWQGVDRLATTTNQNGTSTDYAYDGFARVASIDHKLPSSGASFHKVEYLYDKVHNRRMEKNTFDATWVGTLPSAVQTFLNARSGKGDVFRYDWADRLVDARYDVTSPASEVATPGSQTYAKLVAYTLDGLGNRSQVATTISGTTTTVTYSADVVNQYTAVGGVSRAHDDNGNVKDDGTHKFVYDYRNLIVEARDSSTNTLIAAYAYDAIQRRIEKAVSGGAATRYVLDGVSVVEEFDGSATWAASYTYEDGVDSPRSMDRPDVADVDGDLDTSEVARFAYHQQVIGSVTELTDPSGVVSEWVLYDAFGNSVIRDRSGTVAPRSLVGNVRFFVGRDWDVETETYYFRHRTYCPLIGRFNQRDPIASTIRLYEYGESSPASFVDPTGLESVRIKIPYERSKNADKAKAAAENKANAKKAIDKWNADHKGDEFSPAEEKEALDGIGKLTDDDIDKNGVKDDYTDSVTVATMSCGVSGESTEDSSTAGGSLVPIAVKVKRNLILYPDGDKAAVDKVLKHEEQHAADNDAAATEVNNGHAAEPGGGAVPWVPAPEPRTKENVAATNEKNKKALSDAKAARTKEAKDLAKAKAKALDKATGHGTHEPSPSPKGG